MKDEQRRRKGRAERGGRRVKESGTGLHACGILRQGEGLTVICAVTYSACILPATVVVPHPRTHNLNVTFRLLALPTGAAGVCCPWLASTSAQLLVTCTAKPPCSPFHTGAAEAHPALHACAAALHLREAQHPREGRGAAAGVAHPGQQNIGVHRPGARAKCGVVWICVEQLVMPLILDDKVLVHVDSV